MAGTRAYLHVLTRTHGDPGEILTAVNRLLSEDTEDEQFVTLFLVRLDANSPCLVYASAGQEGYLLDHAGKASRLESTGLPLGIDKDGVVACAPRIQLEPGAIILFLTDGILEAESADGSLFGGERALAVVRACRNRPCEEIVGALWSAVRQFSRRMPQRDDMTVVIIKPRRTAQAALLARLAGSAARAAPEDCDGGR
jgi:sigma-B regulation protein RsbU (phosphoserine phosphatase)